MCNKDLETATSNRKKMSVKCIKIEPVSEIDKLLYKITNNLRFGYIEAGEDKTCLPMSYETIADKIDKFEVRDSDVYILSHPKAGTTWSQEMVWLICNNLNFDGANKPLIERSPFLEFQSVFDYSKVLKSNPDLKIPEVLCDSVNYINNLKDPRFIKSHLPWNLLPKQIRENTKTPKIIYVARNPKDVCVSYYHHTLLILAFKGNFEDYQKLFLAGRSTSGSFFKHVLGFWNQRHLPNVLFIKYEDMKKDLVSVIRNVASFLEKDLDESKIPALGEHLSFEKMKKNPFVNLSRFLEFNRPFLQNEGDGTDFLRSGTVGSYKQEMTPEINRKFDEWIEENLKGTGLTFEYKV